MVIREYKPTDFEEVVDMYYNMCLEVYPHRQFKSKQYFYRNVIRWLDFNYDIMVTELDGIITGFILCYVDSMGGIVDDYYQIECVYVKKKFRKGRSLFLMVNTAIEYANQKGYILSGKASEITESSKISSKYGVNVFTTFERLPIGEDNETE